MLDFRIDTFLEVCRCMSYTKTAENLHITQPAVSQHIHYLEEYYGTKLLIYKGKKLSLTKEGELLYRMSATQKHDDGYLRERLRISGKESRNLHFGVTLTIGEFVIAKPLAELLSQYPDISIHVITANTQVLLEKIKQGEIEFAIMEGNFSRKEYDYAIYSREEFIPVCAKDYVFKKDIKNMEDIVGERLIIREDGSGTRQLLIKDMERRNMSLQDFDKVIEIGNMGAIKSLVSYGCGISFMYKAAVKKELEKGILKEIKLRDYHVDHDFSFVWLKSSFFEKEYEIIFDKLRSAVKQ